MWRRIMIMFVIMSHVCNGYANDLRQAMGKGFSDTLVLTFRRGDLDVPTGGHVQGVQLKHDPTHHRYLAFLSHDSISQAYVAVVAFAESLDRPGQVIHVHRFPAGRLRHAGGIQLHGDILAVGLEDNRSKDRSEVQFWNTVEPAQWQPLAHLTITRSGLPREQTAGAVGLVRDGKTFVAAVANWDCKAIDFYRSSSGDLTDFNCQFHHQGRWILKEASTARWSPDALSGPYQAINLLSDERSQLHLLGFHQGPQGVDVVDLFGLDLSRTSQQYLCKQATRKLTLPADSHFKYGGGLSHQSTGSWILATPRNLRDTASVVLVR